MTKKKKTKRKKRASSHKRRATKPPISAAEVKRLGYEYEQVVQADQTLNFKKSLAQMIDSHKELKAAWERGQFLRNLQNLASIVATVSEAAHKLNLTSGEALRELIDTDNEVADIWNQTRLNTIIAAREALLTAAKEGNQQAIRFVENYLKEEKQQALGSTDLTRLSQKETCELLSVTRTTLNDWENRHKAPRNADRTYNLPLLLKWFQEYIKAKYTTLGTNPDQMRNLKAEGLKLDLEERKGNLLNREEVIAGLIARVQVTVGAFRYKRRELASLCHGQTIDRIENILGRFFEDLQREQLNVPEFLKLPAEAESKLRECLEIVSDGTDKSDKSEN